MAGLEESQITCLTFGKPGTGKTSDKVWSFPNGLHIAGRTAMIPAITTCGFQPRVIVELDNPDLDAVRKAVKDNARKSGIDSVVIDDGSNLLARTLRVIDPDGKMDGRRVYGILARQAQAAIDEWLSLKLHVVMDFHVRPPEFEEHKDDKTGKITYGERLRDGEPLCPGKIVGPAVVSLFETCLRVVEDPMQVGWPYSYHCGPSMAPDGDGRDWLTKDRWNVAQGTVPLNLAELYREAHRRLKEQGKTPRWVISRPPGWEWMEEWVQHYATAIATGAQMEQLALSECARRMLEAKMPFFAVQAVARDIRARSFYLRKSSDAERIKASLGIVI